MEKKILSDTGVKKDIPMNNEVISQYMNPGEEIVGFGIGGSESLTIFLKKPGNSATIVRKILSENLITAKWDKNGTDVMLAPYKKALQQAHYLKSIPETVKPYFPHVDNIIERKVPKSTNGTSATNDGTPELVNELIYEMSFIGGDEVSEFIRKYKPPVEGVARLYVVIYHTLNSIVHSNRVRKPSGPTLEQSYFRKIEKRLELSRETSPSVFSDSLLNTENIYIDGIKLLNVKALLRKFRSSPKYLQNLEPLRHTLVMGDTNTENIKISNPDALLGFINAKDYNFTAEDIGIKFLDPRAIGFHENGEDSGSDDPMYDNKPWHNSLGRYDVIHSELFDLKTNKNHDGMSIEVIPHDNHSYSLSYEGIESHFRSVMYEAWNLDNPESDMNKNDPNWIIRFAFVMGAHFTAMPPFHFHKNKDGILIDSYTHQRRPVAIYAEGIKWLNLALRMLEGRTSAFYGVSVPFSDFRKVA
jgi:hypothetical protein